MARTREFDEGKIIETATDLFWNKGYNAVSTQDLIDAFGISRSSMYGAYKDKHSLFILALQHYRHTTTETMLNLLSNSVSFIDTITLLLNQIIKENITDNQTRGCFIVNTAIELAPHDNEVLEIISQNRKSIIEGLANAIQKGIDNQELTKNNDPKALANYFYQLITGLRADAKITRDKVHYKHTIKLALTVLDTTVKKASR
jgi:TetR/AcrR family transcriptional regulator, transcriptional repressor for nem operon